MIGDVQLRAFVDALLAVHPLDLDAFLLEQTLVIGHELGQALKRRGGFQSQCLHRFLSIGVLDKLSFIKWLTFSLLSNALTDRKPCIENDSVRAT